MRRVKDLIAARSEKATPEHLEARDLVYALLDEWVAGRLPLHEVRRQCSGRDRWHAAALTGPDDQRFAGLHRMLEALIADHHDPDDGYQYDTPFGTFSTATLRACRVRMSQRDGRQRILFPIRRTWIKRPKRDEHGNLIEEGVEGDPVYAETAEERWEIANELRRKPPTASDDKRERWTI